MHPLAFRFVSLVIACVLMTSCGKQETPTENTAQPPAVALIVKSLANEFFVGMADAAREHQATHADEYTLIVNGLKDESDLSQQVALIEQMTARGVDVIVIAPADSKALVPAIKRARDRGVVVVNIDNKLDAALLRDAGIRIPFVGPDNREGAKLAGDYLSNTLTAEDEVAIIGGISTAFNAQQRQQGFEDAMSAVGARIVSVQAGNWEQSKASSVASALISEHPNLKALLCSNDNMAIGAIAAIRQAGKTGDIAVVGYDNIAAARALIKSADLQATVDQFGDQLAIFGIEYGLQILDNGNVPEDKQTPVKLITADNL